MHEFKDIYTNIVQDESSRNPQINELITESTRPPSSVSELHTYPRQTHLQHHEIKLSAKSHTPWRVSTCLGLSNPQIAMIDARYMPNYTITALATLKDAPPLQGQYSLGELSEESDSEGSLLYPDITKSEMALIAAISQGDTGRKNAIGAEDKRKIADIKARAEREEVIQDDESSLDSDLSQVTGYGLVRKKVPPDKTMDWGERLNFFHRWTCRNVRARDIWALILLAPLMIIMLLGHIFETQSEKMVHVQFFSWLLSVPCIMQVWYAFRPRPRKKARRLSDTSRNTRRCPA